MKKRFILMIAICTILSILASCDGSVSEKLFEGSSASHKVTFDSNGGTAVQAQTVKEGEKATKPSDPTKAGNLFKYWSKDGATEFNFDTVITEDINLKALWIDTPDPSSGTVSLGDVTWKVLSIDYNSKQALLISQDILTQMQFDDSSNVYKDSNIREYLNGDFITDHGLSTSYMLKVDVTTNIETTTIFDTGSDYVFLLSKTEANNTNYFTDDDARVAKMHAEGRYSAAAWRLRSPYSDNKVKQVNYLGATNDAGYDTEQSVTALIGVRPAFWYHWN